MTFNNISKRENMNSQLKIISFYDLKFNYFLIHFMNIKMKHNKEFFFFVLLNFNKTLLRLFLFSS